MRWPAAGERPERPARVGPRPGAARAEDLAAEQRLRHLDEFRAGEIRQRLGAELRVGLSGRERFQVHRDALIGEHVRGRAVEDGPVRVLLDVARGLGTSRRVQASRRAIAGT